MNNIIKLLEDNEYNIDDYNKIINLCKNKIYNIKKNETNNQFIETVKNINITNEELKCFFNIIKNTFKINIDEHCSSITISFDYNEYSIDLCIYSDEDEFVYLGEKMHVLNKKIYSYEIYNEICDKKLLKILDLKSVNYEELNEFIKNLFRCVSLTVLD